MAAWYGFIANSGPFQVLALGSLFILAGVYMYRRFFMIHYPAELPRVGGLGKAGFSLRTRLAYYTDCAGLFREAYERVSSSILSYRIWYATGVFLISTVVL